MLNLQTHHVIVSRDIIWLHRMYGEDNPTTLLPPQDELFEDNIKPQPDDMPSAPANIHPANPPPVPAPAPVPTPCLPRELRNLQSDLAPQLLEPGNRPTGRERINLMLDNYDLLKNSLLDFAFISALVSKTMHECNNNDKDETPEETIDNCGTDCG